VTDTSVLIVSYNVCDLLVRCLTSLPADDRVQVIVIDNGSKDGTLRAVREQFPRVTLVQNSENHGFSAATNQGVLLARGSYVLFLNPDAELLPDALTRLREYLDKNPDIGIVGPRVRYPDGTPQSTRRRFPTPLTALLESTVLQRWFPDNRAARSYAMRETDDSKIQDVDWLVGACFLARREVVDQIGGLDERFFMYSEELDWCRRARSAGWRVVYLPTAEVIHYEGKSSEQNLARRAMNFNESKCRYFEKYYGWRLGLALRVYLLANTLYDLGEESGKLLVGHRPDLRSSRIAALSKVARYQARRIVWRERAT